MATGRIGGEFEYPRLRLRPRPQTISGVNIEHPTPPPMGADLPAPPAKTLFFIKYLKNAYFFIATKTQ